MDTFNDGNSVEYDTFPPLNDEDKDKEEEKKDERSSN